MYDASRVSTSKSTADVVFEKLHADIVALTILPGAKISEADVARQYGVSRQPVRDAFRRLHNLDLIEIRPQRATIIRRFSRPEIENTRFVRLAVELEVLDRACAIWDQPRSENLAKNLSEQSEALASDDLASFHALDYGFHECICDLTGLPMAFETIKSCKHKIDRLCLLSLSDYENVADVLADHRAIANALDRRCAADARELIRHHISRLDTTIAEIHRKNAAFFR
ncbi:GntR family transcriptional regulator [Cognatiyoonia sp. IB215446]|uniref:GntR family transcriptional regulator n=1 Tax=Cognatiyoonia sp. IB215446 TaxID=3097355 RepID=UPI002A1427E4|nr:GntR family transcriptional regulator [Cognatiyoonia sp. IB215446]MDX8349296.1 GntR family transcriptional regulator [Cognatiyoonia sp. IB215446]